MIVYLARHASSVANEEGRYCGSSSSPLSDHGKEQAKKLKEKLESMDLDYEKAYTSPSGRCIETLDALEIKFEVERDNLLEEIDFGIFEAMTYDEIQEKYPIVSAEFFKNIHTYRIPNGESFQDVKSRAERFLGKVSKFGIESVFALTHSGFIRAMAALVVGDEEGFSMKVENASIIKIDTEEGNLQWL